MWKPEPAGNLTDCPEIALSGEVILGRKKNVISSTNEDFDAFNRGADKSLARTGRKQARKHVRYSKWGCYSLKNTAISSTNEDFDAFNRGADKALARPGRETSSEACQGRARFQQHRDASCHQVSFPPARQGSEGN